MEERKENLQPPNKLSRRALFSRLLPNTIVDSGNRYINSPTNNKMLVNFQRGGLYVRGAAVATRNSNPNPLIHNSFADHFDPNTRNHPNRPAGCLLDWLGELADKQHDWKIAFCNPLTNLRDCGQI